MNASLVVFGSDAKMTAWNKNTPNELMAQIFNVTVSLVRQLFGSCPVYKNGRVPNL